MNTENLAKYLELKKQLAAIESQLEDLKPAVLDDVRSIKSPLQYEGYDFLVSRITTWTFSPAIGQLQSALTEAKRAEKCNGLASVKAQRDVLIVREHRDRPASTIKQVREAHSRAYEKWTVEEQDVLRNEFLQGQSIEEIAEHLQRQVGGIRSRLVKQGLIEK